MSDLHVTILVALTVIPLVSWFGSKLVSLPLDYYAIGLSIIIIFVARTDALVDDPHIVIRASVPFVLTYVFIISITCTVVGVALFRFQQIELKKRGSRTYTIPEDLPETVLYLVSLALATVFIYVGYTLVLNVQSIFSTPDGPGQLANIASSLFSGVDLLLLISLGVYIILMTLIRRRIPI